MHLENQVLFFIGKTTIDCTNLDDVKVIDYSFGSEFDIYYNKYQQYVIKDDLMILPTKNETGSIGFVIYEFAASTQPIKIGEWFGEINLSSIYFTALDNERCI